ncbi:mannose-P-dolichol utilization defect 1 protein-like [Aplochiton taeniatus]
MATSEEMEELSPTKEFLLTYLMPEKCFNYFFVDFNFVHVPCLKILLGRVVGPWIILGTVLALLPQLWRVLRARSAKGLSLCSILLQLYAISAPVVYCMANNFPLSAWGERLFMLIQAAAIGFLILHYRGNTIKGLLFVLVYGGLLLVLGSRRTSPAVIAMMQDSSVGATVASKVIQAGTNYGNGHTGQLSGLSVFLVCAGSFALIFTSLQETGTSLTMLAHVVSACFSCVLLVQVLCYKKTYIPKEKKE